MANEVCDGAVIAPHPCPLTWADVPAKDHPACHYVTPDGPGYAA